MGENPFEPDDDEETPEAQPEPKQDNQSAAAQRKLQKAEKELEELRAFKVEREQADRRNAVTSVFNEVGLQPEWAEFYQGEEATPEAVKAWAVTKKFLQPEETEAAEPAPVPATGFTPTVIEGGAPLGSKIYSFEEFETLLASDPVKAVQVHKAGRVQLEKAPGGSSFVGRDK